VRTSDRRAQSREKTAAPNVSQNAISPESEKTDITATLDATIEVGCRPATAAIATTYDILTFLIVRFLPTVRKSFDQQLEGNRIMVLALTAPVTRCK